MKLKRHQTYIILSLILLTVEILIAIFFKSGFIRAYFGDYLVVILLYCILQSFFKIRFLTAAIGVLLFSYIVEIFQHINILGLLNIKPNLATNLILGSSFSWLDMLMYTLGILTVIIFELIFKKTK